MEDLDYIDNYFRGNLSPEEKQQFNQRIIEDAAFAEEVSFYLSSLEAIRRQSATAAKQRFRELYAQTGDNKKVIPLKKIVPWLAAAAVITAVTLLLTVFLAPATPQQLAEEYIQENLDQLTPGMGPANSTQQAIGLYNSGKYPEALQQLTTVIQQDTSNTSAKLLAGIVSLRLNKYDQAIRFFEQLDNRTDLFSNPAPFYHAVTLLKRNQPHDKQDARNLLQYVVDKNLDKKDQALEWLKKF